MAKITPYVDIKDVTEKINNFAKAVSDPSGVFESTLKDMKTRAPGKVADAVRSVYNIKKSEITCKKNFSKTSAGTIKAKGEELMSMSLLYEGRALTPLHFGMTPKERPEKKKYKVSAKIKKGKKTVFKPSNPEGGVFLAPASKGSSKILAWERYSGNRYEVSPIKTMSLPQMVGPSDEGQGGNPIVMKQISDSLSELLDKRFNHHMKRHLDKKLKG